LKFAAPTVLRAINSHSFHELFRIPMEHQKLVVDAVIWAFKHTERNVSELGLEILYELLQNVGRSPEIAQPFYQQFLLLLLQDILAMLTDRLHKSSFKMHTTLLRHIFHLVETGSVGGRGRATDLFAPSDVPALVFGPYSHVTAPLFDPAQQPPGQTNPGFLRQHVGMMLIQGFPSVSPKQVSEFLEGCCALDKDIAAFKSHLRDFLITTQESVAEGDTSWME